MLPRHATFVSNGTAKPIPRCSTPRASHEKSSLSQAQIKRSAKSFRQSSGIRGELTETSLNSRELEDLDKCPSQSIRRKRFRPTTLAVWHARLAPCSWLIICCGPQFIVATLDRRLHAVFWETRTPHGSRTVFTECCRTLQQFDERTLADIGLRPAEIEHAVRNGRLATRKIVPKRMRSQRRQAA